MNATIIGILISGILIAITVVLVLVFGAPKEMRK
jgi:hypothetical protein